jgi:ribosomal protein L14E/L6E/L27E
MREEKSKPLSKLKIIYKDPILLLTLCSMVASTFISFFLVNANNHKINILESQIRDRKLMIQDLSNKIEQKRSQVTTLVLLDFIADKNKEKTKKVKEKYLHILPNLNDKSSAVDILEEFENHRKDEYGEIDNVYIEQISMERERQNLDQTNKTFSSIATLLQIIGLALIIVRKDLSIDNLY